MTTTSKLTTAEELLAMGDKHSELIKGEIRTMSPTNYGHGRIAIMIGSILLQYVRKHSLGDVLTETGFITSTDPDTVIAPDVAFVRATRVPAQENRGRFYPGPPDLAVEVLSPSESSQDVDEKVQEYLQHGTRLVWIVNPKTRSVTVFRPGQPVAHLRATDMLLGHDILPDFSVPVADFFA